MKHLLIIISLVLFLNSAYKRIYIAKVNGRPISRLEYIKELEKNDKGVVLDNMITKAIIFQEADKNGIKISDADIQTELTNIRLSVESQGTTLEEILLYQGITYEQLLENIEIQKILEIIFPEIKKMRGIGQGPYHHLDVWQHTLETVRQLEILLKW